MCNNVTELQSPPKRKYQNYHSKPSSHQNTALVPCLPYQFTNRRIPLACLLLAMNS
jgi:hypothetical protein